MQAALQTPSAGAPVQSLANNWRAILGTDCPDALKFVRVEDKVALITNKKIAIFCPIDAPDGFYTLDSRGQLEPAQYGVWAGYPDPLSLRVDFRTLAYTTPITKELCAEFIQWLEFVRRDKEVVYADKVGFFTHNQRLKFDLSQYLQCELPVGEEETMLDPYYLKLAFTEMLRYDQCHLCRKAELGSKTPLIVGNSPFECAMVIPMRRGY